MAVSPGARGGSFRGQNGASERFSSTGEVKRGTSSLADLAGAASGARTKTPRLRERLKKLIFQRGPPHAK